MNQVSKNIPTSSIAGPSKIYPNLDFWFENKPYGNLIQGVYFLNIWNISHNLVTLVIRLWNLFHYITEVFNIINKV
jgi:hypothetical protein